MKKMLVVLVLVISAMFSVNAIGPEFGAKVGMTMSNIAWGGSTEFITGGDNPLKIGLTGGFTMELPFGPLTLGAEVLYTQKGEKYTMGDDSVTLKMDFIEVPVMAKFSFVPMVKVYGGLSMGFLTSSTVVWDIAGMDIPDTDIKDTTSSTELGAIIGVQVKVSKLVLDARYNHGLTDMAKDNEGDAINLRTLYATVGITF